jgi:oxygen-independent coproporphyrinogen-3 oxidase
VTSVFVGGGTPTTLSCEEIRTLFSTLHASFQMAPDAEVTMEANPGTVDASKLSVMRAMGVNRLSIGLQSACDRELASLGRIHTWQQFLESWNIAKEAGFENINVDVMSALPGQSVESYVDTLQAVLGLDPAPEHISAYSLIVEEGTPFYQMYENGRLDLPSEEADRKMYHETKRLLAAHGYERYEISNYARKGYACRHNIGYWNRTEYIGFGIGAASLVGNVRFRNGEDIKAYLEHPADCREDVCALSVQEQMEEFAFLGLRMMAGIEGTVFRETFGVDMESVYGDVLSRYLQEGLLCREGERYFLSEQGLDVSNRVMADFLLS